MSYHRSAVSFSIIVPTIMRDSLVATLHSIRHAGAGPDDEVLVIVDAAHRDGYAPAGFNDAVAGLVADGVSVRILQPDEARGGWGGPARNYGVDCARGSHLLFIDDDDMYRPGAIVATRAMVADCPETMHVWRMVARGGRVLWSKPVLRVGNIGTPMFTVPRRAAGVWTGRYEGDFDFALSSVNRPGGPLLVAWHEAVLVDCG